MRIVVVEDEHNSREGLVRLIGKMGMDYEVVGEAENGAEGMAVIERTHPDLVITDIKMPLMSGLDMLSTLKDKGLAHKMVILTGYSEFEYARKALRMNVSDYLEKPITVADLREVLDKVKLELSGEQQRNRRIEPDEPGTIESLFLRLMDLEGEEAERQADRIKVKFGFDKELPYQIAVFSYESLKDNLQTRLNALMEETWKGPGIAIAFGVASRNIVVAIAQPSAEGSDFHKHVEERLLPELGKPGNATICCVGVVEALSELKTNVGQLLELVKWSMILGREHAIRREDVERIAKRELPYPSSLESQCSRAVVTANRKEIEQRFQNWVHEFKDMKYGPVLMIEYSVRFISYMLKLAGDVHGFMLPETLQGSWQRSIREIRTTLEFERIMNEIASKLAEMNGKGDAPVYSLLIQKAIRLIHERYAEGITLDEIASNVHVTTAYLSGQFNKEVGEPFSSYIRDLRLRKAKELLLGSELRTFEIAEKVGYPDPKYFSRVFKEATGMSPGEYQRFNVR